MGALESATVGSNIADMGAGRITRDNQAGLAIRIEHGAKEGTMKRTKGIAMVAGVVATVLISMFLLGGCGHNPVSSTPDNGTATGGTNDGKGTLGGNVAASASVPADTSAVAATN